MEINSLKIKIDIFNILSGQIGLYTFSNGVEVPAIAILPDSTYGYDYPPMNTKVSGIEVVIIDNIPKIQARIGANDSLQTYYWDIYLKQWDNNPLIDTATIAQEGMLDLGYMITPASFVKPSIELGILSSATWRVKSNLLRKSDPS